MCLLRVHRRNQGFLMGAETTNHMQRRHQNFSKVEPFVRQRYRKMEDQKPWCGLALNQDFAKKRRLKPIKMSELGDV